MKNRIILIHGTFAFDEHDEGNAWWQRNSPFSKQLMKTLGNNYQLGFEDNFIFKWNGANNESDRRTYAYTLFHYLLKLEEKEIPYHIVAHSHGGSLVYNMLNFSIQANGIKPILKLPPDVEFVGNASLHNLKSWTTIGTPFITETSEGNGYVKLIGYLYSAFILLAPIALAYWIRPFFNFESIYFSCVSLGLIFLSVIYFILVPLKLFGIGVEKAHLFVEKKAYQKVEDVYSKRWLGLSSKNDEAIMGLMAGYNIDKKEEQNQEARKINDPDKIPVKYFGKRFTFLADTFYNYFFQKLLLPKIKKSFENYVKYIIIGNDRPAGKEYKIKYSPFKNKTTNIIPDKIENELLDFANKGMRKKANSFRRILSKSSFSNPISVVTNSEEFEGNELIHTTYFENQFIIKEIAKKIRKSN